MMLMKAAEHDHSERESVTRRGAIKRMGGWSLGVAATAAGLMAVTSGKAKALSGQGCCILAYSYYCSGIVWNNHCGYCAHGTTNVVGDPTGKWYWSCPVSGGWRFCGECYFASCSYTFTYTGSAVNC
jgi:hypothetical protein